MDEFNVCLMGKHSYCSQEMVNLLINGKAISNIHDGNIDIGGAIIKGLNRKCEIGQLSLFEYFNNLKVGSYAKKPLFPIYVICSESHYSTIFSIEYDQNRASFDMFYYDSLANQKEDIRLTLTPGKRQGEKRDFIPPIEQCLFTKWDETLQVDWNGTEPLL